MSARNLAGLRALIFTRRSTDKQSDSSNEQQEKLIRDYADKNQMIVVDVEHSKGISGSVTDHRPDIKILLEKAERREYDVLLIQSFDRLTRGGGRHGPVLLQQFEVLGVRVISITNDIPEGDWGPLLETVEFIKGNAYVKSLALNTTRGALAAILEGRAAYCRKPPFAVDRLILSGACDKLFRIRNLRDGTQVKLQPDHDEVIEHYPRNVRDEAFKHFSKRKDERIVLVDGAKADVQVVRDIFLMHYAQQIGVKTITTWLNDQGIPTPTGKPRWNMCSVYSILINPIYVQRGVANRMSQGKFHSRASTLGDAPLPARKGKRAERFRPTNEWIIQRHSEIKIIPAELRDQIWERQYAKLVRRSEAAATNTKQKMVDRQPSRATSHWPLLGSIFDRSTGHRLAGHRCGPEHLHRYYMVQAHRTNPHSSLTWKRKFFPADAVERAVLEVLGEVLGDVGTLRSAITSFVSERATAACGDVGQLESLRSQRQQLAEKKAFALDDFDDLGPELLRRKIAPLTAQIASLNVRIAEAEQRTGEKLDPSEVVEAVLSQLREVMSFAGEPSTAALRSILAAITRTVVDFESREAEIEVRLPEAAVKNSDSLKGMCAVLSSAQIIQHPTQPENALILAKYRCSRRTVNRKPCMKCARMAA